MALNASEAEATLRLNQAIEAGNQRISEVEVRATQQCAATQESADANNMEYPIQVAALEQRMLEDEALNRNYRWEEHDAHATASTELEQRITDITTERDRAANLVHEANEWMQRCVEDNKKKRNDPKERMQAERDIEVSTLQSQVENYRRQCEGLQKAANELSVDKERLQHDLGDLRARRIVSGGPMYPSSATSPMTPTGIPPAATRRKRITVDLGTGNSPLAAKAKSIAYGSSVIIRFTFSVWCNA